MKNVLSLLTLTALSCGLVFPIAAQTTPMVIASEKGFTITPGASTPIVLKTKPGAACDLHEDGATEATQALRFYANGEGYIKIQARPDAETQETRVLLDCAANGEIIRYPLHLRVSSFPTDDMPAPRSAMPVPKGSRIVPPLAEEEARELSDQELISRGYPPRPDATDAAAFASWLDVVSQPITQLPAHLVSTNIFHLPNVQAAKQSANWSGYVGNGPSKRTYDNVHGQFSQPDVVSCYTNSSTYSSFWVGLDGYALNDLVQAGTEADCTNFLGTNFFNYQVWEELLPNQPTEQNMGIQPNPGDTIQVTVWIGDVSGAIDPSGAYAWFHVVDVTRGLGTGNIGIALGSTYFNGKTAEWIMERPTVGGSLPLFSAYSPATMLNAWAMKISTGKWANYSALPNLVQLWCYNEGQGGYSDNQLLSSAVKNTASSIHYQWHHYH